MKKLFFLFFSSLFLFTSVFVVCIFYWLNTAPQRTTSLTYEVKDGSSLARIAYDLSAENVLQWPKLFILFAKLRGESSSLQAGTYEFPTNLKPIQVLDKMVRGDVLLTTVTIPEGLNMWQIAEKLSAAFPHIPSSVWIPYMKSKQLIAKLEFPIPLESLEGFLFPNTYRINPNASPNAILSAMILEFKRSFKEKFIEAGKQYNLNPLQIVTLASIIEKETGLESERTHISSVYLNRLRIGMRLQADPTVVYGIWPSYTGKITKKDLQFPTPYNTYLNAGMPPGPICSPGEAALEAAVNPITTNDLYFVAKGDGSHLFSANLTDHNKAVQDYLSYLKQEKKP